MSSKIKYKTSFQDDWMANNEFSSWLEKIEGNVPCAKYRVCSKMISVSGQGVKDLQSHSKSAKHRKCLPKLCGSTISFPSSSKTSQPVETSVFMQTNTIDVNVKQLGKKTEIMWTIDVVLTPFPTKVMFFVKSFLIAK